MLRSINIAFIAESNKAFVRREQMLSSYRRNKTSKQNNKARKRNSR